MLRTSLGRLALAVGLAAVAMQSARANIYFDVQYASGGAPGSSEYDVNVTPTDDSITLNVYALLTDAAPSATADLFKAIPGGFYVASSTLQGDIPVGDVTQNSYNNAGVSQPGNNYITTYGALGLGGTANSDISSTNWYEAITSKSPHFSTPGAASGGVLYTPPGGSSPIGYEFPLGTITVNFGAAGGTADGGNGPGYGFPSVSTTAALAAISGNVGGAGGYSWDDSNGAHQNLVYTNALVGNGAGNLMYGSSGAGLQFVFTSTGVVTTANPAAIAAALGISGPSTILGGTTASLTGSVTNSGVSPANALNWGSTYPGAVSLTPSSGSGLAGGSSTTLGGTLMAPAGFMGSTSATVTFTGTDASTGLAAGNSPVTVTLKYDVTGKAGAPPATPGTIGGPYGTPVSTGALTSGASLIGIGSTLGSNSNSSGIGSSSAAILAGTLGASSTGVQMEWRSRATSELPANSNVSLGLLPLYSDVVNLTGVTGGASSPYVLQVTYDPATLGGTAAAASAASRGFLYLGYNTSATTSAWTNAVLGNTGTPGALASGSPYVESYATFTANNSAGYTLAGALGAYGVDPSNNDVWAVVNHDMEAAVVPEPGTIALLAAGALALGIAYRRRKLAKA